MEAIAYRNNQELVNCFCKDCMKRERRGCKDMEPMNCDIVKGYMLEQQENGYQIEIGKFIVHPKKNNQAHLEFTDDDLDLIRDILANDLLDGRTASFNDEVLKVINVCQSKLLCPTYSNVEQFKKDTSNNWTEIKEGGEQ